MNVVVRALLIMVDSMAVRESSVSPLSVRDAFNMMMIQCVYFNSCVCSWELLGVISLSVLGRQDRSTPSVMVAFFSPIAHCQLARSGHFFPEKLRSE